MRIVITGGHGFIGSALALELHGRGTFLGNSIDSIVLVDKAAPETDLLDSLPRIETMRGDLVSCLSSLFSETVDAIFHLASAVSAECEEDFDLGLSMNLEATYALLNASRSQYEKGGPAINLLFTSSVAVYGSDPALPMPPLVSEATLPTPQTSYGAQKLACEKLVVDYTRKGFIDGRILRLMTVMVRPGVPNAASSAFVSNIVREPLAGRHALCPVERSTQIAVASKKRTVDGILKVAQVDRGDASGQLVGLIPVNLPALTVSVGEILDALRAAAGDEVADRVVEAPDSSIELIVKSWPVHFDGTRARTLGLEPDPDVLTIIRQYLADI